MKENTGNIARAPETQKINKEKESESVGNLEHAICCWDGTDSSA